MTHSPFLFRVNDEKVSRGYLQALATKMAEELESLRNVGTQTLPTRPLVSPVLVSRGMCVHMRTTCGFYRVGPQGLNSGCQVWQHTSAFEPCCHPQTPSLC